MSNSVWDSKVKKILDDAKTPNSRLIELDGVSTTVNSPFSSPEDWRDQPIYFLFVDRFNNPSDVPDPSAIPYDALYGDFRGGTFEGIRQKLSYLKNLGIGAIWLTPVQKNRQTSDTFYGYAIQDFLRIDPRLASDRAHPEKELRQLIDDAHDLGIYVIFDIVLNHAGDVFAYDFGPGGTSDSADFNNQGEYNILWRDASGAPSFPRLPLPAASPPLNLDAAIWPIEFQDNNVFRRKGKGGESGGDFESLKEIVTEYVDNSPQASGSGARFPIRETLIRIHQYLIAKFDVDGFRIDTLKYISPEFSRDFGNSIREYALSIGKKNFFTFGEVYDNEEKIRQFIGRDALAGGDVTGVEAALDFPLFFKLPSFLKGFEPPSSVVNVFEQREEIQKTVISSNGEVGKFFVTFLDNHDQNSRFYFDDSLGTFDNQLTAGIAILFCLLGIPCLYYGTEQGLSGRGSSDQAVREALWGKPSAFNESSKFFVAASSVAKIRAQQPALRYGRQYFRPISGNGIDFGISNFASGILSFSRLLNDDEILVVVNTNTSSGWSGESIIDYRNHFNGQSWGVLFSNQGALATPPGAVATRSSVTVYEVEGGITNGPVRVLPLTLKPMEIQILKAN